MNITIITFGFDIGCVQWREFPHIWKEKECKYLIEGYYDGNCIVWHSSMKPNKKNANMYIKLMSEEFDKVK